MNVSSFIARRYLFSKKSKSVINIISAISVLGVFVSSAAMVIILSGFNGIEQIVESLYSSHEADLTITLKEGKTFKEDKDQLNRINTIENVASYSRVIEEVTMIKHEERWMTATMKGVDESYKNIVILNSTIVEGNSEIWKDNSPRAIIGLGLQNQLQVSSNPRYINQITIYGLLRNKKLTINNNSVFNPLPISVGGVFNITQELNSEFFIVPLEFARHLLGFNNDLTGIEIKLKNPSLIDQTKLKLKELLGSDFIIKTQYEKNELIYKTNATEKWIVFLIMIFILILSTFNIIASLTMLILDKKKDLITLISIGATQKLIKKIFFEEGLYISLIGSSLGVVFGVCICLVQIKFHLISLENSIIPYWPVNIKISDLLTIIIIVFTIGLVSSYLPTYYLIKKHLKPYFN